MHHFLLLFWANLDLIPEHYAVMLVRLRVSEPLASAVRFHERERVPRRHSAFMRQPRESCAFCFFVVFYFFRAARTRKKSPRGAGCVS